MKKLTINESVGDVKEPEGVEPGYLTPDEVEALVDKEQSNKVSTEKMEDILEKVTLEFGLTDKGYSLISFKDTSKNSVITLTNGEYDLSITVY